MCCRGNEYCEESLLSSIISYTREFKLWLSICPFSFTFNRMHLVAIILLVICLEFS